MQLVRKQFGHDVFSCLVTMIVFILQNYLVNDLSKISAQNILIMRSLFVPRRLADPILTCNVKVEINDY